MEMCDLRAPRKRMKEMMENGPDPIQLRELMIELDRCSLPQTKKCNLIQLKQELNEAMKTNQPTEGIIRQTLENMIECEDEFGGIKTKSHKKQRTAELRPLNPYHQHIKECVPRQLKTGGKTSQEAFQSCVTEWSGTK